MKKTPEQKRIEKMESALKVIYTWASYYGEVFNRFKVHEHVDNLYEIAKKCKEALEK